MFFPIQDSRKTVPLAKATSIYIPRDCQHFQFLGCCRSLLLFENCDFQQNMNVDLNFKPNKEGQDILQRGKKGGAGTGDGEGPDSGLQAHQE